MDNIILYQTIDGRTKIDVKIEEDTVWLSQTTVKEYLTVQKAVSIGANWRANQLSRIT